MEMSANPTEPGIALSCIACVNMAAVQNDIAVIQSITLTNPTDADLSDLTLDIVSTPQVFDPVTLPIDRIASGRPLCLEDVPVSVSSAALAQLTEAETGEIQAILRKGQETLATASETVRFLARDEWGGLSDMPQMLAAFVTPNDPGVAALLKDAAGLLETARPPVALAGYQLDNPASVWQAVGGIWSVATALGLSYAVPPASFEQAGQKIRSPARIRSEGLATCLDTAVLLASAFEAAGLNPAILFAEGHAWVGVWLTKRDFGYVTEPDVIAVRKAAQSREFVAIETTLLTRRPAVGLDVAAEEGRLRLAEAREAEFITAIDIARARAARILPLASGTEQAEQPDPDAPVLPAPLPPPLDLDALPGDLGDTTPETPEGRIARWQLKLLDLSLRNRLLNYREGKQALPLLCPDLAAFEDALADGRSFKAYALRQDDPVAKRALSPEDRKRIEEDVARDVFEKRQVAVPLARPEMQDRLLKLYRKARSDMAEGGTNTLFLAVGFLRWKKSPTDSRTYRAPLILIPMRLERRSAKSDFRMRHHEDDVRFNATLLEFLKRDFEIRIPELDGALPEDDSGIDVPGILAILRHRLRDVPGFEVVDEVALSTFSFAKYLMWKDLVDRHDALRAAPLVRHLVDNPEQAYEQVIGAIPEDELDLRLRPRDLRTPLPADSSQLAAVMAAADGQDFVLIGPPGTGKSQTITNVIAQCLSLGKTVLFVAEKAAALDVVHRRLTHHGLGDLCLELHSHKTDRKTVLAQLGRAWDRAAPDQDHRWTQATDRLELCRDDLNAYVQELHAKGRQGFSVFDAIGLTAEGSAPFDLHFEHRDAHDPHGFARLLELSEALERANQSVTDHPPVTLVTATDWSFGWQAKLLEHAQKVRDAAQSLSKTQANLAARLALHPEGRAPRDRLDALRAFLPRIAPDHVDLGIVPDLPPAELDKARRDLGAALEGQENARRRLAAVYDDDSVARVPVDQIEADWRAAQAKIWPFSKLALSSVQKLLQTYAKSGQADPARDLSALRDLKAARANLDSSPLAQAYAEVGELGALDLALAQAADLRAALANVAEHASSPQDFGQVRAELSAGPKDKMRAALMAFAQADATFATSLDQFLDTAGGPVPWDSIEALVQDLDVVLSARAHLADWTHWVQQRDAGQAQGLGPLILALEQGAIDGSVRQAVRRAYAAWWLPLAMDDSPRLQAFRQSAQDHAIDDFRVLVDDVMDLAPGEVLRLADHGVPDRDSVARKSPLGVLRHQLGLQRPSRPIRTLLSEISDVMGQLTPCVLMSPLSVAQYLPAGQAAFDVVIFDEASQITTWDAIGAIARGRQALIVGDPKQLPPTNFFGRSDDGEDEDIPDFDRDLPSILDEVSAAGVTTRRLNWHYRSRDEALIAFSNTHYYDGNLVTFPSPRADGNAVTFHRIDGVYARGTGRTNIAEAQAIAEMVRSYLTQWLDLAEDDRQTLGVITFNAQQQALIQDQLDQMRRDAPDLEWFFDDAREEPVIVKNLENIQGDERDVMLFSITFGPDANGKTTMNFGALNGDGGEKRLNVAVTRARRALHVFASLGSDEIDLTRTRARGVADLKAFLAYASRGTAALPESAPGADLDAPLFEAALARHLSKRGWHVATQVGVSGVRVDLAVIHPDDPAAFLAGIECDGAPYRKAATARDRDKVRHEVLSGLGWDLLRVWSRDWVLDPETVLRRVTQALDQLLEQDRARRAAQADTAPEMSEPQRQLPAPDVHADQEDTDAVDAAFAALPAPDPGEPTDPGSDEALRDRAASEFEAAMPVPDPSDNGFDDTHRSIEGLDLDPDRYNDIDYTPILRALILGLVTRDRPMPVARLSREVAKAHGWARAGSNISGRVERALDHMEVRDEFGTSFVFAKGDNLERRPFSGLQDRSLREVSRTEIAHVIDAHAADLGTSKDPTQTLARLLAISRLSQDARTYLDQILDWHSHTGASS